MTETADGMCWKCTRCGWIDCYSAAGLLTYGAPTECQKNYHECLVEIDLAEGWAALSDKALIEVRKAERALEEAKTYAAEVEHTLARVRAHTTGDDALQRRG